MKTEQLTYVAMSVALAAAEYANKTPDYEYILWAASGTTLGSVLASMASKESKTPRLIRAVVAFIAGLIVAPWFIGYIPRPETVPYMLHVFGASGVAAACGYMIFSEYPKIVMDSLRGVQYNEHQHPRRRRTDRDNERSERAGTESDRHS